MAKVAINSGADFIVMPGFNEKVVKFCKKKNILCVPGVLTPTEITKAINLGCDILKLFPAEISGGGQRAHFYSNVSYYNIVI